MLPLPLPYKTLATASRPEYVATHSHQTDYLAPLRTRQKWNVLTPFRPFSLWREQFASNINSHSDSWRTSGVVGHVKAGRKLCVAFCVANAGGSENGSTGGGLLRPTTRSCFQTESVLFFLFRFYLNKTINQKVDKRTAWRKEMFLTPNNCRQYDSHIRRSFRDCDESLRVFFIGTLSHQNPVKTLGEYFWCVCKETSIQMGTENGTEDEFSKLTMRGFELQLSVDRT